MLPEPTAGEPYAKAYRDTSLYTEGMGYDLKDPSIRLCKLVPGIDIKLLQDRLKALLDDITNRENLPEHTEPACHGIILDEDTINDGRSRPTSYTVLCPKPHIGEGVFDLVNDKVYCLKDLRLCHIYGQAKIPPFVIRAVTFATGPMRYCSKQNKTAKKRKRNNSYATTSSSALAARLNNM